MTITALWVCRNRKNMTVGEAANKCGVHSSTYRRWERSGKWPSDTFHKMDPENYPDKDNEA
jgi:uncharacterized protein YjcR